MTKYFWAHKNCFGKYQITGMSLQKMLTVWKGKLYDVFHCHMYVIKMNLLQLFVLFFSLSYYWNMCLALMWLEYKESML